MSGFDAGFTDADLQLEDAFGMQGVANEQTAVSESEFFELMETYYDNSYTNGGKGPFNMDLSMFFRMAQGGSQASLHPSNTAIKYDDQLAQSFLQRQASRVIDEQFPGLSSSQKEVVLQKALSGHLGGQDTKPTDDLQVEKKAFLTRMRVMAEIFKSDGPFFDIGQLKALPQQIWSEMPPGMQQAVVSYAEVNAGNFFPASSFLDEVDAVLLSGQTTPAPSDMPNLESLYAADPKRDRDRQVTDGGGFEASGLIQGEEGKKNVQYTFEEVLQSFAEEKGLSDSQVAKVRANRFRDYPGVFPKGGSPEQMQSAYRESEEVVLGYELSLLSVAESAKKGEVDASAFSGVLKKVPGGIQGPLMDRVNSMDGQRATIPGLGGETKDFMISSLEAVPSPLFQEIQGSSALSHTGTTYVTTPSVPKIESPIWGYMQELGGVDLNSIESRRLYRQELKAYVEANGMTRQDFERILAARDNPNSKDHQANRINIQINANIVAISSGFDRRPYVQSVKQQMTAELPSHLQEALNLYKSGVTASSMAAETEKIIEGIATSFANMMVAANTKMEQSAIAKLKINSFSDITNVNGVMLIGVSELMREAEAAKAELTPLMDFLGAIAQTILKFRNTLLEVMIDDSVIGERFAIAKRSQMEDQMNQLDRAFEESQKLREEQEKQREAQLGGGIFAIFMAVLMAVAAVVLAVASFGAATPASTALMVGSVSISGAVAGTTAAVAAGVAVGLAVTGGMLIAQSQGFDLAQAIYGNISGADQEQMKDLIMGIMIALAVILTAVSVVSFGQTSGLSAGMWSVAVGGASLAGAGAGIATTIATARMSEKIVEALKQAGREDAEELGMALSIIASIVIMLASVGVGLGINRAISMFSQTASSAASQAAQQSSSVAGSQSGGAAAGGVTATAGAAAATAATATATATATTTATTVANLMNMLKTAMQKLGSILSKVGNFVTSGAQMVGSSMTVGRNFIEKMANMSAVIPEVVQALMQAALSITTAIYTIRQSQIIETKAEFDRVVDIIRASNQILTSVSQSFQEGGEQALSDATQATDFFMTTVENLSKAVTAITTETQAPQAAVTGGATQRDVTKKKESQSSDSDDMTIDKASLEAQVSQAGSPMQVAVAVNAAQGASETGVAGKHNQKPIQKAFIMMLIRGMANRLKAMLMAGGMHPKDAEKFGHEMANNLIKQIKVLKDNGQFFMGKSGQETLGKNPVLMTLSVLLSKKAMQKGEGEGFDVADLLETFDVQMDEDGSFDDETLQKLEDMISKLAKDDPEMQQLLKEVQNLIKQKSSNPLDFGFKLLQAFLKAFAISENDVDELLKEMMGDIPDFEAMKAFTGSTEEVFEMMEEFVEQEKEQEKPLDREGVHRRS